MLLLPLVLVHLGADDRRCSALSKTHKNKILQARANLYYQHTSGNTCFPGQHCWPQE